MDVDAADAPREADGLQGRWTDVFRADAGVHVLLMASIVFACFQGWLKDRIPGFLPYVLSDLCFIGAGLLWFVGAAVAKRPLLVAPGGRRVDLLLLCLILLPMVFLAYPTPLLVEAAGLRAWSLFPLACMLGLATVRNAGQVRAYVGLILGLCLVTGLYGIVQYVRGPEAALATGFGLARHGGTVFYSVPGSGRVDFRAFSTFTFPAPFAMMMVFGLLLAAGVVLSAERPWRQRLLAGIAMPVMFLGMTVSGTRAALITLMVGLAIVWWLRGLRFSQVALVIMFVAALHVATVLTSGRVLARYQSLLLSEGLLWSYVTQPVSTAITYLGQHPLGLGLGRTGVGVPFLVTSRMPPGYFVFSDGDTGRAAVEMGVLGMFWLAVVVVGLLPLMVGAARRLARGPASDLAAGVGALLLSTAVVILIGSPLSAVPHAVIWWFLFGALLRLAGFAGSVPDEGPDAVPDDRVQRRRTGEARVTGRTSTA
jgi:hypothetical protein